MPVGVFVDNTKRFDLETLPEAYVIIRRMNYGESLKRQSMTSRIFMEGATGGKDIRGEVDIQTESVALWEFANLIVEHNITDQHDNPLNFKNAADVKRLDGPIGTEIGKYIDEFNSSENTDEVKN